MACLDEQRAVNDEFEASLSNPLSYLQPSDQLKDSCLNGLTKLFDLYKKQAQTLSLPIPTGPLPKLYTENFDNEQIWAEIELLNEPALKNIKKLMKKISIEETQPADVESSAVDLEAGDEIHSDNEFEPQDEEDDGSVEMEEPRVVREQGKKSVVDDKFFRLADMEKFLETVEKQNETVVTPAVGEESDSGDEEVDYFGVSEGSDTERLLYDDFFDPPEPDSPIMSSTKKLEARQTRQSDTPAKVDTDSSDNEHTDNGEDFNESEAHQDMPLGESDSDEPEKQLSTHEKKQLKMQERISKLETVNTGPRPWQLSGEAGSKGRPLNSLLAEDLSFDHMTRPAPVVTEETTKTLEDIIKQRVIDEAWDDVERKIKPAEKAYDYSRSRPLEQEKSKLSLAEVYEQEYIKQTQADEENKEDKRHTEIREQMKSLFAKLDALSNFHFTPKPPKPDVEIVANVPAIQMEEVAPVGVSDVARLAPEEISAKTLRPEVGTTEKTTTDRKHDRRLKKRRKRLQIAERKQREKVINKLRAGLGNKYTRKAMEKRLKDKEQSELIDNSLKSSSKFFAALQQQVKDQIKTGKQERTKKQTSNSGQQFKL